MYEFVPTYTDSSSSSERSDRVVLGLTALLDSHGSDQGLPSSRTLFTQLSTIIEVMNEENETQTIGATVSESQISNHDSSHDLDMHPNFNRDLGQHEDSADEYAENR